jgi:membrane glycosyltransferase
MRATRKYVTRALPGADAEMAIVDPLLNALMCAQGVARLELPEAVVRERTALIDRALRDGWPALSRTEQATLLGDPLALSRLHTAVWTDATLAASWQHVRESARALPPKPWQPAAPSVEAARPAA